MAEEKTKVGFGTKLKNFFRSLRSETKKIVWFSWDQTWKNTLVVIVSVLVIAVLIGLLDFGFSKGIIGLTELFVD